MTPRTMRFPESPSPVAIVLVLGLSVVSGAVLGLGAQEMESLPRVSGQAAQSLRPYWHVFAAYAIAIVLIGGWAVSISRRLRDVERRLTDRGE